MVEIGFGASPSGLSFAAVRPRGSRVSSAIGLHQVVDRAGRHALDVGLLDHRSQRLLGHPPRLQEAREVAPLPQLRDLQLDRAGPRLPGPVAVAVAVGDTIRRAFAVSGAGQALDLPALTEFPAAAFEQIATSAGLKDTPPSLLSDYSRYTDDEDEDEEVGFERTNSAHDRLQRFETHMRRFIERTMIAAFGHDWIKQRVPPPIRNAWSANRKKAKDSGEPGASSYRLRGLYRL